MNTLDGAFGSRIKAVSSLAPVAGTGAAQNGTGIDRSGYGAAVVIVPYTTGGGATGGAISVKLQDSDSQGSGFADNETVFGTAGSIAIGAGPNETGAKQFNFDLRGAKRYIRAVIDADPTGGTPTSIVAATIILANPRNLPAV